MSLSDDKIELGVPALLNFFVLNVLTEIWNNEKKKEFLNFKCYGIRIYFQKKKKKNESATKIHTEEVKLFF